MFASVYQSVVILAVVIVFYATDFVLISRYDRERHEGSGRAWDYTLMVVAMAVVIGAQPVVLPWLGLRTNAGWGLLVQMLGLALILSGFALHWWARVHLRQFYTERAEIQPGHYLVDTGPCAYVRNPLFTSFFLLAIGVLLVNPALPTLLVTIYVFWDLSRAAKQEEALLGKNLPGYAAYMARVPRFLPRLRNRSGGK